MPEQYSASPDYALSYQQEQARKREFDQAHTRYVEVVVPPGGEHEIDTTGFLESDNTAVAYLRTSATARGDADALHIEDVHRVSTGLLDGQKQVYGKKVAGNTNFLLVNEAQATYGQEHPESGVRGFATIVPKGEPYEYGRATGATHDFADMGSGTSRRHFSIGQPTYGKLVVRDLGSTHGVAIQKRIRTAADGTPVRGAEGYGLSRDNLEHIDKKLKGIDAARAPRADKHLARELVAQGTYNGKEIDFEPVVRHASDVLKAREFLADTALRDPEVAQTLVDKDIVGLHGTRSIGLLGIMQTGGMKSAEALRKDGYPVLAGEHIYQYDEGQKDTSFASLAGVKRTLESYAASHRQEYRSPEQVQHALQKEIAELEAAGQHSTDPRRKGIYGAMIRDRRQVLRGIQDHPNGLYAQMLQHDFPVLIGISRAAVEKRDKGALLMNGSEELNEFRIASEAGVPIEDTPVVAVPKQYVAWVSERMRQFGHDQVQVVPLEAFVDPAAEAQYKKYLEDRYRKR